MVTWAEARHLLSGSRDRRRSLGDDEEADAAHQAFLHDRCAGRNIPFAAEPCELPPLALAEPAEERHPLQVVGNRCHCSMLLRRRREV